MPGKINVAILENWKVFDLLNTHQLLNSGMFWGFFSNSEKAQANRTVLIYPFSYKDHNKSKHMHIGVSTRTGKRNTAGQWQIQFNSTRFLENWITPEIGNEI